MSTGIKATQNAQFTQTTSTQRLSLMLVGAVELIGRILGMSVYPIPMFSLEDNLHRH
jgi:hypothetical protein